MTQQSRLRRMGWIAVLALCTMCYLALHLKVHAVRSEVVSAERRIEKLSFSDCWPSVVLKTSWISPFFIRSTILGRRFSLTLATRSTSTP